MNTSAKISVDLQNKPGCEESFLCLLTAEPRDGVDQITEIYEGMSPWKGLWVIWFDYGHGRDGIVLTFSVGAHSNVSKKMLSLPIGTMSSWYIYNLWLFGCTVSAITHLHGNVIDQDLEALGNSEEPLCRLENWATERLSHWRGYTTNPQAPPSLVH